MQSPNNQQSTTCALKSAIKHYLHSSAQVKVLEQALCAEQGISLYQLMQRAAEAVFRVASNAYPEAKHWCIILGGGNNAGDGLVLAMLAQQAGIKVSCLPILDKPHFTGEAGEAYKDFLAAGLALEPAWVNQPKQSEVLISNAELIVDAMIGSGLTSNLRQPYLGAAESINQITAKHQITVVAVDIPSGLNADSGALQGAAIEADLTVCLMAAKPGLYTGDARAVTGKIVVDNLGASEQLLSSNTQLAVDDHWQLLKAYPNPKATAYKYQKGHVLIIGGDLGFGGALLLATQAAQRTGAGLVSCITRKAHRSALLTSCPEVMMHQYESEADNQQLLNMLEKASAICLGPGLGTQDWGQQLYQQVLDYQLVIQSKNGKAAKPMVLDADGLNLLAMDNRHALPFALPFLVMTPHLKEAARLLNKDSDAAISTISDAPYQALQALVKQYQSTIILKGAGSLIGYQSADKIAVNVSETGNQGMATAGTGDILAGIVIALLAKGLHHADAARLAVAIHGLAGDAAAKKGMQGMIASDLLIEIKKIINDHDRADNA